MPLIANTNLPSFGRLEKQGETILSEERASHQAIRALHIGLLNMMPDSALEATERQFFRLLVALTKCFRSIFIRSPFLASNEAKRPQTTSKSIIKLLLK